MLKASLRHIDTKQHVGHIGVTFDGAATSAQGIAVFSRAIGGARVKFQKVPKSTTVNLVCELDIAFLHFVIPSFIDSLKIFWG
jgi:hypothetical protein